MAAVRLVVERGWDAATVQDIAAIAGRTGDHPERDLRPQLIAGAVTTAIEVAMDRVLGSDPPMPLGPLLGEALRDAEPTRAITEPETGRP